MDQRKSPMVNVWLRRWRAHTNQSALQQARESKGAGLEIAKKVIKSRKFLFIFFDFSSEITGFMRLNYRNSFRFFEAIEIYRWSFEDYIFFYFLLIFFYFVVAFYTRFPVPKDFSLRFLKWNLVIIAHWTRWVYRKWQTKVCNSSSWWCLL